MKTLVMLIVACLFFLNGCQYQPTVAELMSTSKQYAVSQGRYRATDQFRLEAQNAVDICVYNDKLMVLCRNKMIVYDVIGNLLYEIQLATGTPPLIRGSKFAYDDEKLYVCDNGNLGVIIYNTQDKSAYYIDVSGLCGTKNLKFSSIQIDCYNNIYLSTESSSITNFFKIDPQNMGLPSKIDKACGIWIMSDEGMLMVEQMRYFSDKNGYGYTAGYNSVFRYSTREELEWMFDLPYNYDASAGYAIDDGIVLYSESNETIDIFNLEGIHLDTIYSDHVSSFAVDSDMNIYVLHDGYIEKYIEERKLVRSYASNP